MSFKFTRSKEKSTYKCRICGPLVCRADTEGALGHIAFFIYSSVSMIAIAMLLEWALSPFNMRIYIVNLHLSDILLILATFVGGLRIFVKSFEELFKHREFNVDFLVFFAALGGILIGFYLEAALVVNLFVIADYLETIVVAKAKGEIRSLIKYFPQKARVLRGGKEIEVPIENVMPGEIIVVRPGERIPLDGEIVEGEANIDQSMLTGESIPVYKSVGDDVFGGTFCLDGKLMVRVKRIASESLFNKIIRLVLEAREKKASVETFIEKFANKYVPIVLALSIGLLLGPVLIGGSSLTWCIDHI